MPTKLLGKMTQTILERLGPVLKEVVKNAKQNETVESGFFVNGEWVYVKLGTVAEIHGLLIENKM